MPGPLFAIKQLSHSYGKGQSKFQALKGLDFQLSSAESVAILGKSGSGKSTLMHLLALLDEPTSGSIVLSGVDTRTVRGRKLNQVRNQTFGFVFQQFFLISQASVLENVVLPLKIAGVSRRERKRRGMQVLSQLDLADKAKNRATDLSGGQKQRVVIARALVNQPSVIFADEPTGNLDSVTGKAVEDILFGLNQTHGITLVIVTHDEELAARCDRQLVIRDGLLVDGSSPTQEAHVAGSMK